MPYGELQELEPDPVEEFDDDVADDDADEWDEEALGLDWNEADAQNLVRSIVPGEGYD